MIIKKILVVFLFFTLGVGANSFAHHNEDYLIKWDAIMEYQINVDAFKPKYYDKFPYGFIQTVCQRVETIGFSSEELEDLLDGQKEIYKNLLKNYKASDNIVALFLQCDAISDIRHPPEKETMMYSRMKKAYEEVYDLSVMSVYGCSYNFNSCVENQAKLKVGQNQAYKINNNPDMRNKWLINYYKKKNN